jgi:hypothetical protein
MKLLNSVTSALHANTVDANNAPQIADETANLSFLSSDLPNATNDEDVAIISDYLSLERHGNN